MRFLSKIRFLPLTIFAAVLMLTVKVGDIWKGMDGLLGGAIAVSDAQAQEKPEGKDAARKEKAKVGKGGKMSKADSPPKPAEGSDEPLTEVSSRMVTNDPTLLTQAEIDLLQQLADRREILENREQDLELKQGLLKAAETRIDKKVEELKELQSTIQKLIKTYDEQQDAKLGSLVKIYESMKPKDAALIFQELDMNTLLLVAERMKERKLAGIMSKMDRAKASEITVELTQLRNLPEQ